MLQYDFGDLILFIIMEFLHISSGNCFACLWMLFFLLDNSMARCIEGVFSLTQTYYSLLKKQCQGYLSHETKKDRHIKISDTAEKLLLGQQWTEISYFLFMFRENCKDFLVQKISAKSQDIIVN